MPVKVLKNCPVTGKQSTLAKNTSGVLTRGVPIFWTAVHLLKSLANAGGTHVHLRFHVLMAASMKRRAFWDIVLCSLGVDRCFRGAYCHHHPDGLR
jgi:hypothetical protein